MRSAVGRFSVSAAQLSTAQVLVLPGPAAFFAPFAHVLERPRVRYTAQIVVGHFGRIRQWEKRLLFEGSRPTVPKQWIAAGCCEQGGRVAPSFGSGVAKTAWQTVAPAKSPIVAALAGHMSGR